MESDVPIESAIPPWEEQVEVERKRVSKRRIDRLTRTLVAEYKESFPEPRGIILPTENELKRMVKPAVRIFDRLGWLNEDLPDSPAFDVIGLVLGIGLYGYRVNKVLTLLRTAETVNPYQESSVSEHSGMGASWNEPTGQEINRRTSEAESTTRSRYDALDSQSDEQSAINELLRQDYEGRQRLGLL